jgi:Outer membrane receptor proteins, mostly Fe transport
MKKIILLFLLPLLAASFVTGAVIPSEMTKLEGKITDKNGEPVIGATVFFPDLKTGAITDVDGVYRLNNLPAKTMLFQVSSLGYKMIVENINLATTHHKDFVMEESVTEITEIAVTGQAASSKIEKMPSPVSVVTLTELQQQASTNIIDALSSQPGISQITTSSGISKPVIRGLGYNRVVIVSDGVRQEGQQWGDEHGIEIDEFDVSKVEILKGPASLMYGSDAMAGVINMFTAPVLPQGKKQLNVLTNYQTNNGLMAASLNFAGHKNVYVWDLRYSHKLAHAYQNRTDGYVFNSGFAENSFSGLAGISNWWGYSHLSFSSYQLKPGIVEGNRSSITGQFTRPVALNDSTEGETIAQKKDFLSYTQRIPYQQVNHYKILWNNNVLIGDASLKATIGYQQNQRREFADILKPSEYGLYFLLHTINYNLHYQLPEINGYSFSAGVNGMYQRSLNKGVEFLVPEYRLFDAGVFIVGKKTFGKLDINGGLRFDNRSEVGDALYLDATGQKTHESSGNASQRFSAFKSNFSGTSGSIGATLSMSENWSMKLNLSQGFRSPNISELGSNGIHEGTIRYEIGNPDLKSEKSFQLDYELSYNTEHVSSKLNLFANNINNYIYSHKLPGVQGGDSIRGGYPCYKFDAGHAQMFGGEAFIDIHPHPLDWLHFENSFSYVYSELKNQPDSTRFLPFTPPAKWVSNIRLDLDKPTKWFRNTFFSVGIEHYFKQTNVYSAYRTETPTDAYTLLNAGIGTDIVSKKKTLCSMYINGTNLSDIAYQSHLSRLKYAPLNVLTGKTGVYNMGRNISLKLIIPVNL